MGKPIESRKDEVRFVTDDPKRMLGKWVARRALHTWKETFTNEETGKVEEIERNEVLLERVTYNTPNAHLSSIRLTRSLKSQRYCHKLFHSQIILNDLCNQ